MGSGIWIKYVDTQLDGTKIGLQIPRKTLSIFGRGASLALFRTALIDSCR